MSHNFPPTIPVAAEQDLPPSGDATVWIDSAKAAPSPAPQRPANRSAEYTPRSAEVMDIPSIDDPNFMPALAYWSKRLNCSVQNLAEAHARLGSAPSIKNILSTLARIKTEEKTQKGVATPAHSSRTRRIGAPRFQSTWTER